MAQCPKSVPKQDRAPAPEIRDLRQQLEDVPMCRYSNPIPACVCPRGGSSAGDSAALLSALEQQNALLSELLGAVTGLTAACLCRSREG